MTPKQRVLAEHPKADLAFNGFRWMVHIPTDYSVYWQMIGLGKTARAAWADAARRMEC